MTTPVIDRNAAFAAERGRQIEAINAYNAAIPERVAEAERAAEQYRANFDLRIAEGKVRDNGNGTYTVTDPDSYDNGETLRMRQPRGMTNIAPLALPESFLDESTGTAALYTMEQEWHGLGNVVPEGVSDLDEVLRLGGIDWEVIQAPALFTNPVTGKVEAVPGTYITARSDTGAALTKNGQAVGKVYRPIQNREMGAFLQDLVVRYNVKFLSAGATYGGSHVFIGMRLPDDVVLDLGNGVQDIIEPKLYFVGSHDGTTSNKITVSPWRIGCGNTERFNLRDAVARWAVRHTTNAMSEDNVKEARRTLGLSVKYFTEFKAEMEQMARIDMELREFEAIAADLYPKPDAADTARKHRNWDEKMGSLTGMFARQSAETGKSAYSAERVFTDFLDHAAPKRLVEQGDALAAYRGTKVIEGVNDKEKNRIHGRLLQVVGGKTETR